MVAIPGHFGTDEGVSPEGPLSAETVRLCIVLHDCGYISASQIQNSTSDNHSQVNSLVYDVGVNYNTFAVSEAE